MIFYKYDRMIMREAESKKDQRAKAHVDHAVPKNFDELKNITS